MSEKFSGLEEALQVQVNLQSKESLVVSKIIDIDQIALIIEGKAGSKFLGSVLKSLEKNIFSGDDLSKKITSPDGLKTRQGVARAIETVLNSLAFFEQQVIDAGMDLGEIPEGSILEDFDSIDVVNAIEIIGNLVISYAELIKDSFNPDELTDSQKNIFGLTEKEKSAEVTDPGDLLGFSREVSLIEEKLYKTNDPNESDYFDPRKKPPEEENISIVKFLKKRIGYFRFIYSFDGLIDPVQRAITFELVRKYIKPAEELLSKLIQRIDDIEKKEFNDWKDETSEYLDLDIELKGFEDSTNGIPADGSVSVADKLITLNRLSTAFDVVVNSSEYVEKRDFFDSIWTRFADVLGQLQVVQYMFLTKSLVQEVSDIEKLSVNDLKTKGAQKKIALIEKLNKNRFINGKDILQDSFFAEQISDVYGVHQEAQNKVQKMAGELKERFTRINLKLDEEKVTSVVLENMRSMDLQSMIKDWHTKDIAADDEPRMALEIAYKEKLEAMEEEFLSQLESKGDTSEKAKEKYENFKEMYGQMYGLVFFGIMRGDGINTLQGTAKHRALLGFTSADGEHSDGFADIDGAMALNVEFNKNPLVGSENLDQGEMFGPNMGIVQMIVFAMFQEQKKLSSPFSRNQGYTANLMVKLIDSVCDREEVEMWHGGNAADHSGLDKQINIKDELSKFSPEIIEMIKLFAQWKFSRDDLGSKAGIWHWGRNKGAFKFKDGVSPQQADGWLAALCYQTGKNAKKQGHLASEAFVTPENTDFMSNNHENDDDIERGIERVDQYLLYKFPQLRGLMYEDQPPGEGKLKALHKYSPENWWEDFPGLDHFFNKTTEVFVGGDYEMSRTAVFRIIEMATESVYIEVPNDTEDLETFLNAVITSFDTQIGMALAYIGKFNDHGEGYKLSYPVNELNYVHELIIAAMKFYLMNILTRIPVHIKVNQFIPKKLSRTHTKPIPNVLDMDYHSNYRIAVEVLVDLISRNSTLATFYQKELVGVIKRTSTEEGIDIEKRTDGVTPFLENNFRTMFRDETVLAGKYRSWLVETKNKELIAAGHHELGWKDKDKIRKGKPEEPYHFKVGAFLKSEKDPLH